MTRAPHKRLLTPRDPALYPLTFERVEVAPAALIAAGDLLAVLGCANGRRIAMRAPIAGRMLRIMVSAGERIDAPRCAMTMREEPDLAQHDLAQAAPKPPPAKPQQEPTFEIDDLFFPPDDGFEMLGNPHATPASAAAPERVSRPPSRRPALRSPYDWIHRNSGEHEAEAPYSKWIWAGLVLTALLLVLLVFIPREFFPWESETAPVAVPELPRQ